MNVFDWLGHCFSVFLLSKLKHKTNEFADAEQSMRKYALPSHLVVHMNLFRATALDGYRFENACYWDLVKTLPHYALILLAIARESSLDT